MSQQVSSTSALQTSLPPPHRGHFRNSQYSFVVIWFLSLLVGWYLLRLVLFLRFSPPEPAGKTALLFVIGVLCDFPVAVWLTLPVILWFLLFPDDSSTSGWRRPIFWTLSFFFWFAQIFILFVEYFFFDEFRSRFNTVAVDYLQYPNEVFVNIWDSYHVGLVVLSCALAALAWVWVARKAFGAMWEFPFHSRRAACRFGAVAAGAFGLAPLLMIAAALAGIIHAPLPLKSPRLSEDRSLNEIANNGQLAFFSAALTHNLDYQAFYKSLDKATAYQRVRQLLETPATRFSSRSDSIQRLVSGDPAHPRLNVVILLEESLGSEFWGCLGRKNTLTPEMDALANQQGILFTNLYASGNRTVRGMEGVLASFPPLPGESIVKREFSDNVETIARVLKRDGYSTIFLYGGRGVFDGMRSFALRNGYDRFIEQKQFDHPTFTTAWGVCDEDLFARSIQEFRELSNSGKPFFATVLSVSNHKPYTYPRGRIPEDPGQRHRENAVKYSDFALGEFFRAAKKESFWTNTIFAVVADHGARVYGEQSIPIHSYEIPLLIVGPAVTRNLTRVGQLGSSLDVAPTLLGLIGRPYTSTFFGQDLLHSPLSGRALLNHNRDIGMLEHERLIVLGLMSNVEFYYGDPKAREMQTLRAPNTLERDLQTNAIALFQVADDLYTHQRYRIYDSLTAGR